MDGTKILLIAAAGASVVGSFYTSRGPDEVLYGIVIVWAVGFALAGLKLLVLKLFSKKPVFLADVGWMTLCLSGLGFGSQLLTG